MAAQPKGNIGNTMIITPNRERNKKTTHPYISANNTVNLTGNSIEKLLKNYWGTATPQYKAFAITSEITQYCPNEAGNYGMMTFRVEEADIKSKTVANIATEAFNQANLGNPPGLTTYRFVLEGYYIWRHEDSEYAADGFGHIGDAQGPATHILATFGKEKRGSDTWYHLILRAGNIKSGVPSVIEEFTAAGNVPPGSGAPIPPPKG
jgi:hypothetical protein